LQEIPELAKVNGVGRLERALLLHLFQPLLHVVDGLADLVGLAEGSHQAPLLFFGGGISIASASTGSERENKSSENGKTKRRTHDVRGGVNGGLTSLYGKR